MRDLSVEEGPEGSGGQTPALPGDLRIRPRVQGERCTDCGRPAPHALDREA